MKTVIFVETHNTDRPATSWVNGAVKIPPGVDRLVQRNGRTNVNEWGVLSQADNASAPERTDFVLSDEPVEKWFAEDLYPVLGNDKFFPVSWLAIDR